MNDLHINPDTLDALIADTCARLADLAGTPCPTDPGNQLQLLCLLQTGIHQATAEAILEALEAGYTDTEIDHLRSRLETTP